MLIYRLCRAIALAANDIKLTDKQCSILEAVIDAMKYITGSTSGSESGSLEGFLALTDSIINAIKIADPKILKVKEVSLHDYNNYTCPINTNNSTSLGSRTITSLV